MEIKYPYELIGEGYITKYWLDNVRYIELPIDKDLLEKRANNSCKYRVYLQLIPDKKEKQ